MTPDAVIRHSQGGRWSFSYTTNEAGHRGPWPAPEELDSAATAIVPGDSFAFGIGVNDGEEFPARLQHLLSDEWTVLNGGMGGWGIDSQIKWFHRTSSCPVPALAVILQFTANDPADSNKGVTEIRSGGFRFHSFPYPKPHWQEWISRSGLIQRSHLYSLVRTVAGALRAPDRQGPAPAPWQPGRTSGVTSGICAGSPRTSRARTYRSCS